MTNIKTIFKSNGFWGIDEWYEAGNFYKEAYPDLNEEQITQLIYDEVYMHYTEERTNLYKHLDNQILVIANIGRWNGRFNGYKILNNNLNEILNTFNNDDIHIYSDGKNILSEGMDHDGKNYYLFREIKDGVNIDKLLDDIYDNKEITSARLSYYTKSLVPYVNNIYGWK